METAWRIVLARRLIFKWRALVYKRILYGSRLSLAERMCSNAIGVVLHRIIVMIWFNRGRTAIHLQMWSEQTSVLFAPERTPLAVYASSTVNARIALESLPHRESGNLVFVSHGRYMMQNLSSVIAELARRTNDPYIIVLSFRRQVYPHVEQWWKDYALALRIKVEIVHNDSNAFINRARNLLSQGETVVCAPDFFFATGVSFARSMRLFERAVELFLSIAERTDARVLYVSACSEADYANADSFVKVLEKSSTDLIRGLFERELERYPEAWFFSYNHYDAIASRCGWDR